MIILEKTATRITSVVGEGQDCMLLTCAEQHQLQVTVVFVCTVVAHTTPLEITPASPMIGTMYHNYHRSVLITFYIIFQVFLQRSYGPQV